MASGFITLPNGKDWSTRWSGYDLILETIMQKLGEHDDEGYLKKWLEFILPTENDVESGYCFFKVISEDPYDSECVLRIIDTRYMHPKYYEIFWKTVETLNHELDHQDGAGFLINSLQTTFECNQLSPGESIPDLKGEEDHDIFFIGGFNMGK